MKLKRIPTSSIVLTIFALTFIVWGAYQNSLYSQGAYLKDVPFVSDIKDIGENTLIGIKEKIVENETPKDTMNGIFAQCLVLERKVEMYQYVIDNDEVYMQYSSDCEGDITGRGGEKYVNPEFPAGLESAVFFGTGKTEGSDLIVGPRILNEMTNEGGHLLIGDLIPFENSYGLKPNGNGGYDNCRKEKPEIGDIRITYTAWISSDFDDAVIIGTVSDGIIGSETDKNICMVDFDADSPEEIYESNFSEYRTNAEGIFAASVIFLIIAVVIFLKNNKKNKNIGNYVLCLLVVPAMLIAMSVPGNADFGDFGGDYDYGGYDSGNDYGGYDSGGDYGYNSGGNDYNYSRTTTEPTTTTYYSAGSVVYREPEMYNVKGKKINPEPANKPMPEFSKGENAVFAVLGAAIVLAIVIAVVRRKNKYDNYNTPGRANSVKSDYIPGAAKTDRSELHEIGGYLDIDPSFSASEFKEKISNLYIRLQNGWQKKNLEELRPYLTDAFYAQSDNQLERYRRNNQTNIIEKIAVLDVNISGWKKENGKDIIIALIQTRITDYVIDDESGEVVSGSRSAEKFMTYEWRMERTSGVRTSESSGLKVQNCPNCGAAVNINHSAKCEFCGSILTTDTFDWVLGSIKGISQKTVGR